MSGGSRQVQVRRVYDAVRPDDGVRVLVDGLWPRGIRKDELPYDEWATNVAPSSALRKWFAHDTSKFATFTDRYLAELETNPQRDAVAHLRDLARRGTLTLLTATRDVEHSHAAALAGLLSSSLADHRDLGGESVCWLDRVCPECGRLTEGEPGARCPQCGTPLEPR